MKNLIIGLTPPLEGGSEQHIFEISSRIDSVEVLTQNGSKCKNKIEMPYFGSGFLKNISFALFVYIYSVFFLLLSIRKKYSVVHIHENTLYFLIPLLKMRYNVIVTVHGITGFKFFSSKIFWPFFRIALSYADIIIAVNRIDEEKLKNYFSKVTYLPNGVDLSIYSRIKINKIEKRINFIGRIHEQKGIIYLLQAFELLNKKYPEFKLEIIGEVNDYAKQLMKEFKNKNIIWKGYISDRKEIVRRLKSSYCIILPSLWEGLPLTLFESFASGRPLILSDISAFKSIVNDEALFFKSQNVNDLVEKMKIIMESKTLANNYGKKGEKLSKDYDWKYIAKGTSRLYG